MSTSVGVRGATVTLGPRGAYANVGLPGSGLSNRTRLDTPSHVRHPTPAPPSTYPTKTPRTPIRTPGVTSIPDTEVEIKSADVGAMTSSGLGGLKQLINEATIRHGELRKELAKRRNTLDRAAGHLQWAQSLIIRLFTAKSIPRLVDAANNANDELEETQAHLDGCFVEVDYAFDDASRATYAALVRSFEALRTAQRIWDVTATAAVDRVAQRTTASSALTRKPVAFDFATSDIIRSQHRAMRLGTATGRDIQIFPGFAMMRDAGRDFALIEYSHLECHLAQSNFIEEEFVPPDAEQVGSTWKRANKDGSRDRRFNDNYQIPILRYGALVFSSPTGLAEAFQISNYGKAADFAHALGAHKRSLANLNNGPRDAQALPAPADEGEIAEEGTEPAFVAKQRKNLAIDWVLLAVLVLALAGSTVWVSNHWTDIRAALAPAPPVTAPAAVAVPPPPAAVTHKGRRHRRRAVAAPTSEAPVEDSAATAPPQDSALPPPPKKPPADLNGLY